MSPLCSSDLPGSAYHPRPAQRPYVRTPGCGGQEWHHPAADRAARPALFRGVADRRPERRGKGAPFPLALLEAAAWQPRNLHLRSELVRPGAGRARRGFRERGRMTRSEEHTSELQSLLRISYAVFCLKNKIQYYTLPLSTPSHSYIT